MTGRRHLEPVDDTPDDDTPTVQGPRWTCPTRVKESGSAVEHACDRRDPHDHDPMSGGHHWYAIEGGDR